MTSLGASGTKWVFNKECQAYLPVTYNECLKWDLNPNHTPYNEGLLKAMKQDEDRAAKAMNDALIGNASDVVIVDDPHVIKAFGNDWDYQNLYIAVDPATGENDMHLDWVWGRNFTPEETRRMDMGGIVPGTKPLQGTIGNTSIPVDPKTSPSEFWDDVYKKAFDSQQKVLEDKPLYDGKIKADTPAEQDRIWDLLKEAAR